MKGRTAGRAMRPPLATKGILLCTGFAIAIASLTACEQRRFNQSQTDEVATESTVSQTNIPSPVDGMSGEQNVVDVNASTLLARAMEEITSKGAGLELGKLCETAIRKARFVPDVSNPTAQGLAYFMFLSLLAYQKPENVEPWKKILGLKTAEYIVDETTDTQAYLFDRGDALIVAFGGTKSLANVITDLDLAFDKSLFNTGVHRGFLRSYRGKGPSLKGIRSRTLEALRVHGYPSKKLYVVGHSLGGALASLLAAELAANEQLGTSPQEGLGCDALKEGSEAIAGVVTFGSTRVGNQAFAQCYNRILKSRTLRVVNNLDLFPLMAARRFYEHVGQRVFLDENGQFTFERGQSEEPTIGLPSFLKHIADGHFLGNVFDHVSYANKLAYALDPACPKINPVGAQFGVR